MTADAQLIRAARGDAPPDLLLTNARIVDVFTGQVERDSVAISGGRIAGIGDYSGGAQVIDLAGKYLAPGFINGHTHVESSMLDIGQYARTVIPRGTSIVITDLHEIANVAGLDGMRYVLNCARRLPFEFFLMAPSCVPATQFETPGAYLEPGDIRQILRWPKCLGLGEVMNYPGVINTDPELLQKINLAAGQVVNGHAPGLTGKELNAYVSAGIYSDHETISREEGAAKLSRGMWLMLREGSSEKNLESLLPLVNDRTYHRCFFVTDDRSCKDLMIDGDIDAVVRRAIRLDLDPVRAVQMATLIPAAYFRLERVGGIAPGYDANLVVLNDLETVSVDSVFFRGRLVARDGEALFRHPRTLPGLTDTVRIKPFTAEELKVAARGERGLVIELVPGQITTRKRVETLKEENGFVLSDTDRDILKAAVFERHRRTGRIGLGLVKGFGLKRGAVASSVAHDAHNIVAIGTNDIDMAVAVKEIENLNGGLAVAAGGRVVGRLPLPVAGLLSAEPVREVSANLERLEQLLRELGSSLPSPFAALSFLALPVIPELRLTDRGLVDVNEFKMTELFSEV